jgi:hypothetical protein
MLGVWCDRYRGLAEEAYATKLVSERQWLL